MERPDYGRVIDNAERAVGFYLPDSFNMLPFISALEPLRVANRLSKRPLYQWRTISDDGSDIHSSSGMRQRVDQSIATAGEFSLLVVSGPFYPEQYHNPAAA